MFGGLTLCSDCIVPVQTCVQGSVPPAATPPRQSQSCCLCTSLLGGGLVAKSCLTLVALCTVAHQAPLSMGFSRQGYWSGLHFLLQGIFPTQESNPGLLHCRQILYQLSYEGSPYSLIHRNDTNSWHALSYFILIPNLQMRKWKPEWLGR